MTFLITGSSGFIGQNLVLKFKESGYKTIGIDIAEPRYVQPDEFIKKSFCELDFQSLFERTECIIHLAAGGGVTQSVKDPINTLNTNVIGFVNLLQKIKDYKNHKKIKIIYASSGGTVIGDSDVEISEDSIPNPKSPFGISKYCTEMFSNFYQKNYDLNLIGLRFTNVYGPMMDHKPNFIAKLMLASIRKDEVDIYGDGNQSRDFIYIEDVIESILLSVESQYNGVLQIGSGKNITINGLIENFSKIKTITIPKLKYKEKRKGDVLHVRCNCQKAFQKIGFKTKNNVEEGLIKTYKWFKENTI